MSDVTTPANPTGQIAATPAVLSPEPPIAPTSGTKRVPDDSEAAVVHDAQRYDWREDLDGIYFLLDDPARDGWQQRSRLAAYIERLEDLLNGYRSLYDDTCDEYASLKAERDALLAEHEAIEEARSLTIDATIYHDAALFPPTTTPRG